MAFEHQAAVFTLGCKLNQVESEAIAAAFTKAGFSIGIDPAVPQDSPECERYTSRPSVIIINTCTVTSKSDQKARRIIRKVLREHPHSCVIVTGCYARLDHAEIESIEESITAECETENAAKSAAMSAAKSRTRRLFVVGGRESGTGAAKSALLALPSWIVEQTACQPDAELPAIIARYFTNGIDPAEFSRTADTAAFAFSPESFAFHSRGYLKIQDGCDNNCAYCRVHLARGPSVSLAAQTALERLRLFESRGCAELMITGVNISQYRHAQMGLAELLEYLLDGSTAIALRISSLEPEAVDQSLATVFAHPRIRPHFHLSVQSASNTILRKMGRSYDRQKLEDAVSLLRSAKDNPFLACDIIAGFPGETAADFAETAAFCEKTAFAWIHAFPYSRRRGTPAFDFDHPVCERETAGRVAALTALALRQRREYACCWLGRELSAVVEQGETPAGQRRAVSENYLKLIVRGENLPPPGTGIRCTVVSVCDGGNGERPDAEAAASETFKLD